LSKIYHGLRFIKFDRSLKQTNIIRDSKYLFYLQDIQSKNLIETILIYKLSPTTMIPLHFFIKVQQSLLCLKKNVLFKFYWLFFSQIYFSDSFLNYHLNIFS